MLHDYARFAAAQGRGKAKLEILYQFLVREAKIAVAAGIVGLHQGSNYNAPSNHNIRSARIFNNPKSILTINACEIEQRVNSNRVIVVLIVDTSLRSQIVAALLENLCVNVGE